MSNKTMLILKCCEHKKAHQILRKKMKANNDVSACIKSFILFEHKTYSKTSYSKMRLKSISVFHLLLYSKKPNQLDQN